MSNSEGVTGLDSNCSVAQTLEALSNGWTFLVLREMFFGHRRFEQFQSMLQVPRNTLVQSLRRLMDLGLIQRVPIAEGASRHEYRFTRAGIELYPTMLALLAFGDRWLLREDSPPLELTHTRCGKRFHPLVVCSHCQAPLEIYDVHYRNGPGAGWSPRERARNRRASDRQIFERVRPCSVARTLSIIGDRWSILVLRQMQLGVRRFDEFQSNLGIAPNILTDRLRMMVDDGIARRELYQSRPDRYEYRFTPKGRDLYGTILVVMRWGDKWVSHDKPPLLLRHKLCQHDFHAVVACSECLQEIDPREVQYRMNYALPTAAPSENSAVTHSD